MEHFADGYVPWFGLTQVRKFSKMSKAAVFTFLLSFVFTTANAQKEIVGNWQDKSHAEKVVVITPSGNYFASEAKVFFIRKTLLPNTKHIVGKWGSLKVSGSIDNYKIESINLFTISGQDKIISIPHQRFSQRVTLRIATMLYQPDKQRQHHDYHYQY